MINSINSFRKRFPAYSDDKKCLSYLFRQRYGRAPICRKLYCKKVGKFRKVQFKNRKCFACSCDYQIWPCAETVFHKSSSSLTIWFYVIFLMSEHKNKISAEDLAQQTGRMVKTAKRMKKLIAKLTKKAKFDFRIAVKLATERY